MSERTEPIAVDNKTQLRVHNGKHIPFHPRANWEAHVDFRRTFRTPIPLWRWRVRIPPLVVPHALALHCGGLCNVSRFYVLRSSNS
jgi:hypothetical protein